MRGVGPRPLSKKPNKKLKVRGLFSESKKREERTAGKWIPPAGEEKVSGAFSGKKLVVKKNEKTPCETLQIGKKQITGYSQGGGEDTILS